MDADGEIVDRRRVPTDKVHSPAEVLAGLRLIAGEMLRANGAAWPPAGTGIAIPANLDHHTGRVAFSGALGWHDVPVRDLARQAFGCDAFVDDDVAAGALADLYFGSARDATNLLYVAWGTGIGAGIVINHRVYHSRGGASNELGHMPADPSSLRLCYCGCRGCLEIEAGGKAMVEQCADALARGEPSGLANAGALTMESIAAAAQAGDPLARRILKRSATLLARVLAGALALLNPDTVVFGGGISRCFDIVQGDFDEELHRRAPAFSLEGTRIVRSAFADWAGVVGAACLPLAGVSET